MTATPETGSGTGTASGSDTGTGSGTASGSDTGTGSGTASATGAGLTLLTHNQVRLALHHLRPALTPGVGRPLLILHGLGETSPSAVPEWATAWPGAVYALDFTGHGASTVPAGGGYSAEILLADADVALAHLTTQAVEAGAGAGAATEAGTTQAGTTQAGTTAAGTTITVVGRGLGAYIALQLAGARASQVHGTVLCDGPGLAGGAVAPTSQSFLILPPRQLPPDPYALFELSRDLRPPDYATLFVRLAVEGSGLDEPIAVAAMVKPPWLAAVADEIGVVTVPVSAPNAGPAIAQALAAFIS